MRLAVALLLLAGPARAEDAKASPADPPGVVRMSNEQQQTVRLDLARAERRPITEPVRVPGAITFDPGHVAVLRPFEQARILRLLVQPGDAVVAGQRLADLDMPGLATMEQDLAATRAATREADAGVAVARESLHRGELLARDGSLARAEADRRRLVLAQAAATAETARAKTAMLQVQVDRLNPASEPGTAGLVTPIAGTVVSAGVTPGEAVDPSREAFTVADLSVVLVLAQVPEGSAAQVAVNEPGARAAHRRRWDGRVATLGAALDPRARTLPVRIRLDNGDGALRAGMFVDVTITHALGRDAAVVPSAAVQLVGDKRVVFTPLGGDRFQSHDVTVGIERQDWVELRSGVEAGSQVVTRGSFELKALLQKSMLGGG